MTLFKKKSAKPEATPAPDEQAGAAPKTVTLASGRLAPVFLQMYLWILSVNLNYNVYQVESGLPAFGGENFPQRGSYDQLVERLAGLVLEENAEELRAVFGLQKLAESFRSGRTNVSCTVCVDSGDAPAPECFELRAERIMSGSSQTVSFLIFARRMQSDSDTGSTYHRAVPVEYTETGDIDWAAVRARKNIGGVNAMRYEYEVASDRLIMHIGTGNEEETTVSERYLASLDSRSDYVVFHDSVKLIRQLFRDALDGRPGEAEVSLRANNRRSSPFRHYKMTCIPLEDSGAPTWIFGSMTDIEEDYRKRAGMEEAALQIGTVVDQVFNGVYMIDTEKNTIVEFVRTKDGFRPDENVRRFSDYIKYRMDSGVVAEESREFFASLLRKGTIERKVGRGTWETDVRLKLPGSLEYMWYSDTIAAVPEKPHRYLLYRRDITAMHEARQREFEMSESLRLAKYNQAMMDTLADLVEFRNMETGAHIYHVRTLTRILLEDMARRSPQYNLSQQMIELYCQAATLHDVGKITLPDSILNKSGKLTVEEYELMKTHTTNGARIVSNFEMAGQDELKKCCYDVALHHHERWDGKGYPEGLFGDEISIYIQAVGLADAYDALVSERCYKKAIPFDKAVEMILNGECGVFNPRLLESFTHRARDMRMEYVSEVPLTEEEMEDTDGK